MKLIYKILRQDPGSREGVVVGVSALGILVNLLLAGVKIAVGILASSIAVISEGLNNASDCASSLLTIIGTKLSSKRPTKSHPFGFGRVEYLTSLIIAVIILFTGGELLISSIKLIINPGAVNRSYVTLSVVAVSAVVKLLLGGYTEKKGRQVDSGALIAVGKDCRNDSVVSAVTIISALIFLLFRFSVDAWAGIITSGFIIKSGIDVMKDAVSVILGKPADKELADKLRVDDVMTRSHGMFLTTGPTGCGKSTTLYAMLLELRRQRINILTIEDPVEFHIPEIQQMQVNRAAGFTFASAMRNFLRHDPDVIMVGEIRDRETAGIAVESALTGHLLLSTLHTNTAATTITRLLDLGVEAYLLRASLLAVISQRLVRLTCPHCREVEPVDAHVRETLGVGLDEVFHRGRGCSQCEGLGVHRRQAVYELLVMSPRLRELIAPGAEADTLHRVAMEEGMRPITAAAIALARTGAISLSEAWRVRAD